MAIVSMFGTRAGPRSIEYEWHGEIYNIPLSLMKDALGDLPAEYDNFKLMSVSNNPLGRKFSAICRKWIKGQLKAAEVRERLDFTMGPCLRHLYGCDL